MTGIIFCACTDTGLDVLNFLISKEIKISYIISLDHDQAVRYKVSGYASFSEIANKYDIPIYFPKEYSLKNSEDLNFFEKNNFLKF